MTGGPWYDTSICKNDMEQCLKNLLEIKEFTDIISCVLLMHMIESIYHILMMSAVVLVMRYHKIR